MAREAEFLKQWKKHRPAAKRWCARHKWSLDARCDPQSPCARVCAVCSCRNAQ